ncbi:MAG: hypothetical protein AAF799_12875 [Myxococcota bacterium]
MPAAELHFMHDEPAFVVASWRHVLITVFWRRACVADLERLEQLQEVIKREFGHFASLSVMLVPILSKIDEEARKKSGAMAKANGTTMLGAAVVVGDSGLRATIMRSLLTGIMLLGRTASPTKPFSNVPDATQWLLSLPGNPAVDTGSMDALAAAVMELADSRSVAEVGG